MPKPSAEMRELFASVAPAGPGAVQRKMFGQEASFVGGNMFMGLFGDQFNVRLSPEDREVARAAGCTPFEPMGRAMKEYVVLPAEIVGNRAELERWVQLAYQWASTLPEKAPKPRKARGK